jgi:hypothetical protein
MVAFATALLAVVTLGMAGAAVLLLAASAGLAAFILAVSAVMALMTWITGREALANWRVRIVIDGATAHLILPRIRGFVAQAPMDRWLPLASIAMVEQRDEAFRSLGTTALQRAYALVLHDGSRVVLGADRQMKAPFFGPAAQAIAAQAAAPLHDLGLVDGKAGPVLVAGNTAPDWTAAPLSPAVADKRRRAAALTWSIIGLLLTLMAVAQALSYLH